MPAIQFSSQAGQVLEIMPTSQVHGPTKMGRSWVTNRRWFMLAGEPRIHVFECSRRMGLSMHGHRVSKAMGRGGTRVCVLVEAK